LIVLGEINREFWLRICGKACSVRGTGAFGACKTDAGWLDSAIDYDIGSAFSTADFRQAILNLLVSD